MTEVDFPDFFTGRLSAYFCLISLPYYFARYLCQISLLQHTDLRENIYRPYLNKTNLPLLLGKKAIGRVRQNASA